MCDTCGCNDPENTITLKKPGDQGHIHFHDGVPHRHEHGSESNHQHTHNQDEVHEGARHIEVQQNLMHKNDLLAERNRGFFEGRKITAFNLVSSPGSGKTTILERTIRDLKETKPISVIEGDQQTMQDADRIQAVGVPVIQINTGNGCHLDAEMIHHAVQELEIESGSLLFIENVGNLVCPALFDLGERKRVVIISVTEGEDKPLKYPTMFETADLCLVNKIDLLPYVQFDIEKMSEYAHRIKPDLNFLPLSAQTGKGMDKWYDWIREMASF